MVFVNSMSDLFHEDVPFEFINAVFAVMADVNIHTYQILTKRPERMLDFFSWKRNQFGYTWAPSVNVWIGVSVEDQKTADSRIPKLLQIPAAVRFLSCEPMLGEIDIASEKIMADLEVLQVNTDYSSGIDWVICGGESGPSARPMHPKWVENLRDLCDVAGIPFFFKQWGSYGPHPGIFHHQKPFTFEDGIVVYKASKYQNGRMLDGCYHENYPKILHDVLHRKGEGNN